MSSFPGPELRTWLFRWLKGPRQESSSLLWPRPMAAPEASATGNAELRPSVTAIAVAARKDAVKAYNYNHRDRCG